MSYIGNTPASQSFTAGTDTFSGTGSQTAFTLTRSVNSVNDILVVVNNVDQQPSAYSVSGTTLTMSAAPSSGTNNVYVRYLSTVQQTVAPSQGSVAPSSLTTGGPSWNASGNLSVPGSLNVTGTLNAGAVTNTTGSFTGNLSFNSGFGSAAIAYGCRAWVNFNATGVIAIRGSGNVTSITDNATGDYTINFTNAMPDGNYAVALMAQQGAAGDLGGSSTWNGGTYSTTAVRVRAFQTNSGSAFDPVTYCVSVFR